MKLDAVLVFVDRLRHSCEIHCGSVWLDGLGCEEFGNEFGIQREWFIRKRGVIGGKPRESQSREIVVMRWSNDEDAFTIRYIG